MIIMDPLDMKLLIQSEPDPSYPYNVRYTVPITTDPVA